MDREGRVLVGQFLRFNLVGVLTVLLGTAVFLAMAAAGLDYIAALVGDYGAGIAFSYFMNKRYTFKAEVAHDAKPFALTLAAYAITFLLNAALLALAVDVLALDVMLSQLVIMGGLAMVNFVMFKFVVFRPAPGGEGAAARFTGRGKG